MFQSSSPLDDYIGNFLSCSFGLGLWECRIQLCSPSDVFSNCRLYAYTLAQSASRSAGSISYNNYARLRQKNYGWYYYKFSLCQYRLLVLVQAVKKFLADVRRQDERKILEAKKKKQKKHFSQELEDFLKLKQVELLNPSQLNFLFLPGWSCIVKETLSYQCYNTIFALNCFNSYFLETVNLIY